MRASSSMLWLALLAATPALAQQDLSRVSGDIQTQPEQTYGGLNTVSGDITFVSGDVTVGIGSHVKGRVHLKKPLYSKQPHPPRVVIGPGAVVDGPLDFELPVTLYVHRSAKVGAITGATPITFSTPTSPKD